MPHIGQTSAAERGRDTPPAVAAGDPPGLPLPGPPVVVAIVALHLMGAGGRAPEESGGEGGRGGAALAHREWLHALHAWAGMNIRERFLFLLNQEPEAISLDEAALLVAAEEYPDLDIAA